MYSRFRFWHHCPCDDLTCLVGRIHPDLNCCSLLLSCKGVCGGRQKEERKEREGEGRKEGREKEMKGESKKRERKMKEEGGRRKRKERKKEKETT